MNLHLCCILVDAGLRAVSKWGVAVATSVCFVVPGYTEGVVMNER
jgi:hypothetical protein